MGSDRQAGVDSRSSAKLPHRNAEAHAGAGGQLADLAGAEAAHRRKGAFERDEGRRSLMQNLSLTEMNKR